MFVPVSRLVLPMYLESLTILRLRELLVGRGCHFVFKISQDGLKGIRLVPVLKNCKFRRLNLSVIVSKHLHLQDLHYLAVGGVDASHIYFADKADFWCCLRVVRATCNFERVYSAIVVCLQPKKGHSAVRIILICGYFTLYGPIIVPFQ